MKFENKNSETLFNNALKEAQLTGKKLFLACLDEVIIDAFAAENKFEAAKFCKYKYPVGGDLADIVEFMLKEEFHNNEMPKIKAFINAQKELNKASKTSILNFRKKANETKRNQEKIQLSCFCQQLVNNIQYN